MKLENIESVQFEEIVMENPNDDFLLVTREGSFLISALDLG